MVTTNRLVSIQFNVRVILIYKLWLVSKNAQSSNTMMLNGHFFFLISKLTCFAPWLSAIRRHTDSLLSICSVLSRPVWSDSMELSKLLRSNNVSYYTTISFEKYIKVEIREWRHNRVSAVASNPLLYILRFCFQSHGKLDAINQNITLTLKLCRLFINQIKYLEAGIVLHLTKDCFAACGSITNGSSVRVL